MQRVREEIVRVASQTLRGLSSQVSAGQTLYNGDSRENNEWQQLLRVTSRTRL